MTIQVDTSIVRGGADASGELASQVNGALAYFDGHIDTSQSWVTGALMDWLLAEHSTFASNVESGIKRSKTLMVATQGALEGVAQRFDDTEYDAQVDVRDLFSDLDPTAATTPITSSTARQGLTLDSPVAALVEPESSLSDPAFEVVWNILNWPDYLSLSYWGRQLINAAVQLIRPDLTGGQDLFEFLAQKLSGDWDKVALAGSAFGHVGQFFEDLAATVQNLAVDLFAGWPSGNGADRAGEYFAELVAAFAAQPEVYGDLKTKYTDAAWAAWGACQAMLSAIDTLVDAVIAAVMGVESVAEAIAAIFTLGGMAPAAAVSAVIAAAEAFSSAWGAMMTATTAAIAAGATLGAATTTIEFVPIPEA
ncbi:hypothetical protein [Schumannella soli]|uniref:Uncharacterized protein n=1 Tax=Schumannella soli TaxID=2590779 RepID=A0A506XSY9_9MICO|nr:hypothetical protein [Schumannella soli]TPW75801.1 hypothetical protein FJ657_08030 [Schumannella soli]